MKLSDNQNQFECVRFSDTSAIEEYTSYIEDRPTWIIEGLLPVGLTILATKPEDGKTTMASDFSVSIATGTTAMGAFDVRPGSVLYLALDHQPEEIADLAACQLVFRERLWSPPENLIYFSKKGWRQLGRGFSSDLRAAISAEPGVKCVVVDSLATLGFNRTATAAAQEDLGALARECNLSIFLLHRIPSDTDDTNLQAITDELSQVTRLAGKPDRVLWLRHWLRDSAAESELVVMGPDMEILAETRISLCLDDQIWRIAHEGVLSFDKREAQDFVRLILEGRDPTGRTPLRG